MPKLMKWILAASGGFIAFVLTNYIMLMAFEPNVFAKIFSIFVAVATATLIRDRSA